MQKFNVKKGDAQFIVDAVSFDEAVTFVQSDGFAMANLWKEDTGLPFNVWMEEPSEGVPYPRSKQRVKYGTSTSPKDCISVSYFDRPTFEIRAGSIKNIKGMSEGDVKKLRSWLTINYELLQKLANGNLSGTDFRNALRRI